MRFISLKLNNYRGIDTCEVSFESNGITVVQGPNEAGKTSLGESIGLLFEFPDNSRNRKVMAIDPVHRDAGPEIELVAETGPFRFTYFKRFHKKPETRLTVTEPVPESLTGREAHERAEAILRETIDMDLWKALTLEQGEEISQPDLSKQTSLSAALDRAAGGRADDSQSDDLFEKVHKEYLRYFTEGGLEKKELKEGAGLESETQNRIKELEEQISALEMDIERSSSLQTELSELEAREKEQAKLKEGYETALSKISDLKNSLNGALLRLESARRIGTEARQANDERQRLIERVADSNGRREELRSSENILEEAAKSAEKKYSEARDGFEKADSLKREAESLARLRTNDYEYYNNRINLDLLNERKDRIDQARARAAEAERVLATSHVDSRVLDDIQTAERVLIEANARLETGSPHIMLCGLARCELELDGGKLTLEKDEEKELTVSDEKRLTLPEFIDIKISAGSSLEDLSDAAAKAGKILDDLCRKAAVADPASARKAYDERAEAEKTVAGKKQIEKADLRDLSYEELEQKINGLDARVSGYLESRMKTAAMAADLDSAKVERNASAEALEKAARELERTRQTMEVLREVREEKNGALRDAQTEIRLLDERLRNDRESLNDARSVKNDQALQKELEAASKKVVEEEEAAQAARNTLEAENPDQTEALAETARGSLQTTRARLEDVRRELIEVGTRLKTKGEEGLHEQLEEGRRQLESITRENAGLFRRAGAVSLLFKTMRDKRDESRRAYVAPLKQAIEHLGKLVFNSTFQVEIDEDLKIVKRTDQDITVPFESLSGGTREQLALIFRLACCMIMAEDGGAPLILDDALGYSDSERLKTMGAVLAKAAQETQIIVFTCMPSRYSDVGEARVVSLG
ncbi:MAG: AAA family ATPase [Actinobacteria bacterium]|nr:AAA family ATPase [Actinomycetota bacterium]